MADNLFTLLQVSDLHVGRLMPDRNAPLPQAALQFPFLEGMLGHHHAALADLQRFYARERVRSPELEIAVTEDLTADGSPDQFDLAASFLAHNGGPGFGLGASAWRGLSVSGHHDQWGGVGHPFGASVSRLRYPFSKPFPQVEVVDLADGSAIEFILVDSDSDVPQRGHERLLARGRFHRQLDHLEGLLDPPDPDRIRVLMLHHALSIDLAPAPAGTEPFPLRPWCPLRRLEIQRATMERLERMVADHRIQVVLSGHVHTPRLSVFAAQGSGGQVEVLEARCGTTTQRDRYSPSQRRQIRQAEQAFHMPPRSRWPRTASCSTSFGNGMMVGASGIARSTSGVTGPVSSAQGIRARACRPISSPRLWCSEGRHAQGPCRLEEDGRAPAVVLRPLPTLEKVRDKVVGAGQHDPVFARCRRLEAVEQSGA